MHCLILMSLGSWRWFRAILVSFTFWRLACYNRIQRLGCLWCPSLISHPFLNLISFLSPGPPGYSKWTSFAHRTTLQNEQNIAKCILMSDSWGRVSVFGYWLGPFRSNRRIWGEPIHSHTRRKCCVLATLLVWGTSNTISPLRFPLLLSIRHCENDFGTKVTSEVGVTWYFDRAIQIPFLRAKWLNFEGKF